ncbi:hypothetical protein ACFVIY_18020 [Streptomyces sp. NPDC127166]|uniref:hypothetical protein n=1 Tax=Streptomyces sp. NPDC127166 TaxID=3345380 RepID=UPI00362E67CA
MSRVSQSVDDIVEFGVAIPFDDFFGSNVLIVRTGMDPEVIREAAATESPEALVYSRRLGSTIWTEVAA